MLKMLAEEVGAILGGLIVIPERIVLSELVYFV
jgi:hypothetical protein